MLQLLVIRRNVFGNFLYNFYEQNMFPMLSLSFDTQHRFYASSHISFSSPSEDVYFFAPIQTRLIPNMAEPVVLPVVPARALAMPVFDLAPDLVGYRLLPIPDAKSQLYLADDGRVYSFRREMNVETGRRAVGLFCSADRYFVTINGKNSIDRICMGHPGNPCDHVSAINMHIFHSALRAVKLLCCDFMDRGVIPAALPKGVVVDIINLVFRIYGPEYPVFNAVEVFNHRLSGFKFLRTQTEVPRSPWAVVRVADEPVLAMEMVKERARGPAFDLAYQAMVERFPIDPEGPEEPDANRGINDNVPELAAVFQAVRALGEAVGTPAVSIVINYQGPRGGRRQSRHQLP